MDKLKLFGRRDSAVVYPIREFLRRSVVDFEWIEVNNDNRIVDDGMVSPLLSKDACAIQFPDDELVVNPTVEQIARHLGWINKPTQAVYDLSIYGAGPAGLSAAVYAASEGLKTILVEKVAMGGQAGTSSLIENYMGFPKGISGAELAERARQQALKFGVEILLLGEGIKGDFSNNRINVDLASGDKLVAKANICATGVEYASLNLHNERDFFNKGVYYGAGAGEACFCTGEDVFIVGGGNSAGQAASYFSGFAKTVYMVIRKSNLAETLSDYLVKRVTHNPNIVILYNSEVKELEGDNLLQRIKIFNSETGEETWHETGKLFICIGGKPNTHWADATPIIQDRNGYLITGSDLLSHTDFKGCWTKDRLPYHLETSVPGSFAAGDVRFNSVKRVASAVGEGAMAVTMVHKYLAEL
ncbi:NAD(P)/FAD-dependent oxidoreductase [Flavobacterium subsaxonicum]|uniref:Pyridine nucleotide-disulfide oxidoreductase n=1 Tax=Flavobacterium subsaxonicum WB 4.1-42 = DSM 21790 TaxID=1121898 RepID=A0A0A2MTW7_9FLAO|nr:FAD-dependent oxidoreductase [Flavobacterium subsaxonicum]KGO94923.1 pyridine nucleotide-disulfide oxidoreductase [Flavobacterium subsaxonicum WB 4.1-42 = DSM 21790]